VSPLTFLVSELVEKTLDWPYEQPYGRPGGDWPLLPASDGQHIVLVAGRGSALLCLDPPQQGGTPPHIVWAHAEAGWHVQDEPARDAALGEGRLTFQPGPLVSEGRVFAQVRQGDATSDATAQGRERARLVALDLATGDVLWTRFAALGSDPLPSSVARFGVRRGLERAGEPLLLSDGRIFVGTGFGLGALYDAVDGRLVHALKNRRRDGDATGWEPGRGPRPAPACGGAPDGILWAPPDSDRLYRIAAQPALVPGADVLLGPVEPLGTASELVGGDGCTALVQDRAGARRALSAWNAATGERLVSLELGREERFQGSGLVSPARALVASDRGLYLFDRTRELYLLDVEPFEARAADAGGSLRARGDRLFVVGRKGLTVLRAVR
jgi:outer membrane protein assembly factor BamB